MLLSVPRIPSLSHSASLHHLQPRTVTASLLPALVPSVVCLVSVQKPSWSFQSEDIPCHSTLHVVVKAPRYFEDSLDGQNLVHITTVSHNGHIAGLCCSCRTDCLTTPSTQQVVPTPGQRHVPVNKVPTFMRTRTNCLAIWR